MTLSQSVGLAFQAERAWCRQCDAAGVTRYSRAAEGHPAHTPKLFIAWNHRLEAIRLMDAAFKRARKI